MKKQIQKLVLVIILTVFFDKIGISILNLKAFLFTFVSLITSLLVIISYFSIKKIQMINETTPSFLNFVNLTMSTGKSFANAFEIAILYQKPASQPFYKRIFERVFSLKLEESGFLFFFQQNFYKKIFKIANTTSYQKEKVNKLRQEIVKNLEIKRKEKALKAPFWLQTGVIGILYFILVFWTLTFKKEHGSLIELSFLFFIVGMVLVFYINHPKLEI